MTNTIANYNDLLREKQRLKALLQAQKLLVKQDIEDIKQELAPVKSAVSFVGKLATKDKSNVLLTGIADTIIDLVVKKVVLSKAGWITKIAVPFVMKNFSSHVIADNKDKLIAGIMSLFRKKHQSPDDEDAVDEKRVMDEEEED